MVEEKRPLKRDLKPKGKGGGEKAMWGRKCGREYYIQEGEFEEGSGADEDTDKESGGGFGVAG